jgi:hypothetical protein
VAELGRGLDDQDREMLERTVRTASNMGAPVVLKDERGSTMCFFGAEPARLAASYADVREVRDMVAKKACAILVFAKAPVAGEVKTRLIPALAIRRIHFSVSPSGGKKVARGFCPSGKSKDLLLKN